MARNNARGWRAQDDISAAYMAQRNAEARAKGQPITTVDDATMERYVRGANTPVLDSVSRRRYVQSDPSAGWRAQDDITAAYMAALNAANRSRSSDTEENPTEEVDNAAAGSDMNFFQKVWGLFENAGAAGLGGLRNIINDAGYRSQAAAPLQAGDDAYYKAMMDPSSVQIPEDTRTPEQRELDEYMGLGPSYTPEARAMAQAIEDAYKKLDETGVTRMTSLGDKYAQEVAEKYSGAGDKWQRAYGISQSVGQQVLPMAAKYIPVIGPWLSSQLFFGQASGGAIDEALAEGADWDKALTYGTAIGGVEAATEALGDLGKSATIKALGKASSAGSFGKALTGVLSNNNAARTLLGVLGNATSEGGEEVLSDLVSPFARSIYNDKSLGENWRDEVTVQKLWDDFLGGFAVGGLMDGAQALTGGYRGQNQNYQNETVNQAIQDARTAAKEHGIFSKESIAATMEVAQAIETLEGQQAIAAQDANRYRQIVNEMKRAQNGDVGAQERLTALLAAEAGRAGESDTISPAAQVMASTAQNTAQESAAAQTEVSPAASVMADILQNPVNRSQANRIINDANLRAEYEAYTGETLPTVKSEAAKAVMEYSRNHAELTPIAQTVLGQRAETAPVSDVSTDTVSPAAQTMADVLTGKGSDAENPYSSGDYASTYTAADGATIRKDAKTFRNVVAGIDTSVKDFFSRWRNGRKSHLGEKIEKLYLGKVTDAARQRISDLLGYDVTSKDYIITSDGVKHVFDQHGDAGKETARGNIPLTDDIIEKLPEVLANPDSIDLGHQESRGDRNGIVFQKAFPNGTIVYIQFDNSGRGTIEGKTIYAKKAATTSGVNADASTNTFTSETTEPVAASTGSSSANVQAPASTSETSTTIPVGNPTIPQAAPTVNPASPDGTKLSRTVETARDAGITPEPVKRDINTGIEDGKYRYIPESNDDAVSSARSKIAERGYESVLRDWTADVRGGKTGSDYTATGAILYNEALQAGNTRLALDILADYQQLGTNTAQGLQAFRIMKDLAPEDRLYMVQRSVDNLYNNLSDGAKKKLPDGLKIDETLAQEYVNATDAKSEAAALKNLQKDIAKQIPNTFADRFTALRYLNMLGNFRTQIRNLAGNTGMAVTAGVKNTVRYTLERAIEAVSGGKYQRNTSLVVHPDMMNAARADYDAHADFINGDAKYNDTTSTDSFARGVKEQRRVFTSNNPLANLLMKPADLASRATNWAMEKGDTVFIKQQYARYLGGYLEAHKMDADTFSKIINGEIQPTAEQMQTIDNGRVFAAKEAQEATFHDTNAVSKWISQIGRKPGTPWLARMLSEGVAPFRKTPANVAVRAVEYSPLGFLDTAAKAVQAAKGKNGVSGSDVINSLSKSLTGTGLFALGMVLRNAGWLRGKGDDEEQAAFEKLQGMQDYSLVLPNGTSVTIDWLSPAAIPMFMGVALADEINDGGFETSDVVDLLAHLTDPMIQMSMLQGVNDTLESVKYSGNSLGQVGLNIMLSYAMQGLTNTMLGQAERTFEDRRYSTFLDADNPTGKLLQSKFGKALAKIPGIDYNQVEYVDAWGRTEYSGSPAERAFENFLSPGYLSKQNSTEVDGELQRLYDAGQTNVFPQRISMSQTVGVYRNDGRKLDDRALTKDEYVQYQKVMGQTSLELVKSLMRSPIYQGMSDESKAAAISEIYGYARRMAAMEVEPSAKFGERTDVSKLSNPAAYYAVTESYSTASKDSENRNYSELDALTSSFKRLPADVCNAVIDKNSGFEKLLDAKENGYNAQQYYRVYDSVNGLTPAPGYENVATWQKIMDVCSMSISDDQKDYFTGNYFQGSMHDKYMAARERGYNPYSVAVAYQTYSTTKGVDANGDGRTDTGSKKKAFISAMMAQGASESSAEWLYELFS